MLKLSPLHQASIRVDSDLRGTSYGNLKFGIVKRKKFLPATEMEDTTIEKFY